MLLLSRVQAHAGIQKLLTAEHEATEIVKQAKDGAREPRPSPLSRTLSKSSSRTPSCSPASCRL